MFRLIMTMLFILIQTSFLYARPIGSQTTGSNTGFSIPRFASLASDTVNMRKGPSEDYIITWHFIQDNLPVEIIFEQQEWRKVRAFDGTTGWMHRSVLSGQRTGIIIPENTYMYRKPETKSKIRAILEKDVVVVLSECIKNWCKVNINNLSGWVERSAIWGIYNKEML